MDIKRLLKNNSIILHLFVFLFFLASCSNTTYKDVADEYDKYKKGLSGETTGLVISDVSVLESQGTLSLNVSLSNMPIAPATTPTVNYRTVQGFAEEGFDYTAASGTLTWAPGDSVDKTIDIDILDDSSFEGDETFEIEFSDFSGIAETTRKIVVTITDDESTPTVSFRVATQSNPGETDGSTLTVTAELSNATNNDVDLPFTINESSTATGSGADYSISGSPLVIPAGSTSADIIITLIGDTLDEDDETITIDMGLPTNATLGAITTHTATIIDNDGTPTVTFTSAAQASPDESDGSAIAVTALLSAASGKDITVPFSISGSSTATGGGTDYSITASPVTIPAGLTSADITITIVGDSLDEIDETIVIDMGTPVNAALGAIITHTATITDDDGLPTVNFTTTYQSSADETNGFTMTITAQVSAISGLDVTVPFTINGASSATGGDTDYNITASPITITAGSTTSDITITIVGDILDEIDETITVDMGTPTNATLGVDISHIATITDDDSPPTVTFTSASQASVNENNGSTMTVTAQLSALSGKDVTVPFSVNGSSTATGSGTDYNIIASPITITAGFATSDITITIAGDTLDENNETITVDMGTPVNATPGATTSHTATITDDDTPPTVTFTTASQSSGGETGILTITAELSNTSGLDVTVPFTVNGASTATGGGTDYSITGSPITITAGSASSDITITIAADTTDENDETVIVDMGTPTNATQGAITSHTATIIDDDAPPTVTFTSASQTSAGESGTMTITAQLSSVSGRDVTVPFTENGSSTATGGGTDYSLTGSPITITAGSTSLNITITIAVDTTDENDETVIVDMGTPTNATQGATTTHTATITDDDSPPTVTFTSASQSSADETNGATMTITAQLSAVSGKDVTIPFSVNGGSTATGAGTDYNISGSPLSIIAGSTTANITVTIVGDTLDETNETVIIDMGTLINATQGATTTHTATITDDDATPTVTFTSASQSSAGETGTMTITAQLSATSGQNVTVPFTVNGASTATGGGADYSISASPLNITAGSTTANITITITTDGTEENDETVIVDMGSPTNATVGATTTHTATITDDDRDGPQIVSAEYFDTDGNGKLDHIKLTFDETLNDSSFDGWDAAGSPNDQLHNVTTIWAIAGRVNVRLDTRDIINNVNPADNGANDTVIWLAFDEIGGAGVYDTDSKPDLTATDSSLRDFDTGNCYVQTDNANCITQTSADIITTDVTETDKASAIITSVSGVTSSAVITISFSEPVDGVSDGSGCQAGDTLVKADFQYNDVSAANIDNLDSEASWTDENACDDNQVQAILTDGGSPADLTAGDINMDTIQAVAASIYDAADNVTGATATIVTGAIAPYVLGVYAAGPTNIRITFSEPVDTTQATTLANYTLIEDPVESGCAGSGNDSISLTGTVTQITTSVYELSTDLDQCSSTTYRLTASTNIIDQNESVALTDPTFGNFIGNDTLRMISSTCLTQTTIKLVFNKAVAAGTGGAESTTRYRLSGGTDLGNITNAVRGGAGNENEITLTHEIQQSGGTYIALGSNGIDGDGFDDAVVGAIQNDGLTEDLQATPFDRASFNGCGTVIESFDDGPIVGDPYGDQSDFGYLTSYNSQVYIGPNVNGYQATRFDPDGTNPATITFEIDQDTDHLNTATTRDGGIAVPPYVTMGYTGCTVDSGDRTTGCGPDNEDGRGLFSSGTLQGSKYLFLGGARSDVTNDGFDYLYYTSDLDTTLNFKYIDLGTITGTKTQGLSAMVAHNDRLYVGMAKANGTGGYNLPDFGKINFSTGSSEGDCTPGNNCDATDGTNGARFFINWLAYFGGDTDGTTENASPNWAYIVGVDSLFVFNDIIYAANGGHPAVGHNGSIIRSNNNNPATCTSSGPCNDWTEIGPRTDAEWHNSSSRFSLELTKTYDLIPGDKAFAQFAEFNGNLYVTRTACNVTGYGTDFDALSVHTEAGCTDGTVSNREAQLWKCVPGTTGGATTCEAGDWVLIDGISASTDGLTNFGDADNGTMTIAVVNGSMLYIGFDNVNGVEIWRTKSGITNPTSEDDFEQVGGDGLGDPVNMTQIFSAISIQQGADYYIYISAGKNNTPVEVYRNVNN